MSAPTDAEFTPLLGAEPAPGDARSARRTSARVTALGAALSVGAVAAIACAGLGGGSALAALGAPGVVPGARPAGDTLALHPGDDFWDVVDRGFAETRRQARAAAGAAIGLVRTPVDPNQPSLGSVQLSRDAAARKAARIEARRAAREEEHKRLAEKRQKERRAARAASEAMDRKRVRVEARVAAGEEGAGVGENRREDGAPRREEGAPRRVGVGGRVGGHDPLHARDRAMIGQSAQPSNAESSDADALAESSDADALAELERVKRDARENARAARREARAHDRAQAAEEAELAELTTDVEALERDASDEDVVAANPETLAAAEHQIADRIDAIKKAEEDEALVEAQEEALAAAIDAPEPGTPERPIVSDPLVERASRVNPAIRAAAAKIENIKKDDPAAIRGDDLTYVAEVEAEEESARRVNPEVLEEDVERMDAFVQDVADAEEGGGQLSPEEDKAMKKLERVAARVEQRRTREADKQEVMMAREDDVATHPEALRRELERIEIALENVNAARDAGDGVEEARDLAEAAEALERAVERNADAVQEGLAERARRAEQSAERSVMRRAEAADEEMETLKRVVEDAEVREESDDAAEDAETEAELEMLQARLDAIRLEEKRALEQARGVEMTPTAERQAMKDAVVGPDVAPAPDSAEEAEAFSVVGPDDVAPAPESAEEAFSASAKASATKLADELLKEETSMDELTAELIPTAAEEATIESVEAEAKAIMDDAFNEYAAESDAADDASAMDDAAQYDSSEASVPSPLTEEDAVDDAFAAAAAATKGKMDDFADAIAVDDSSAVADDSAQYDSSAVADDSAQYDSSAVADDSAQYDSSAVADDSAQYDSSAVADDSAQYDSSAAAASADDSAQYDSSAVADDSAQYDSSAVADDSAQYDSSAAAASVDDSAQYDSSAAAASADEQYDSSFAADAHYDSSAAAASADEQYDSSFAAVSVDPNEAALEETTAIVMTKAADASESNVASTTLLVDDEGAKSPAYVPSTIDTTRDILDGARAALDGEDVSVDEDFDRAAYDVTSRELAKYAGEIPTGNDVGARAMEAIVAEKEAARDANVERDAWFASTRASMGTPDGDAEATSTSTSRSMSRRESADDEVHPAVAKYGGARAGGRANRKDDRLGEFGESKSSARRSIPLAERDVVDAESRRFLEADRTSLTSAVEDILGAPLVRDDADVLELRRRSKKMPSSRRPTHADVVAAATLAASETRAPEFRNAFGEIPGLLQHVERRHSKKVARADDMRYVTYANDAYWPVARVLLRSLARNSPETLTRTTVMLTSEENMRECAALAERLGHDCFLDADVSHVLGEYVHDDGSQIAGTMAADAGLVAGAMDEEKAAVRAATGKALRVAWCWRKVHVVYSLVKGGFPVTFLDASTVVLGDLGGPIRSRLDAGATIVTLSDFGGEKEQETINTGILAARPGAATERFLEQWMELEKDATETEQAYLTWDLAPRARATGMVISALPHDSFPSFLTFDKRRHISDEAAGWTSTSERGGYSVHAAYCGSIPGKLAFLERVENMARFPGKVHEPSKEELEGCDTYDRDKFLKCGRAPWDGDC